MIHITSPYGGGYFEDEYEADQFHAYLDERERCDAERAAEAAAAVATCAPVLIAAVRAALNVSRLRMLGTPTWDTRFTFIPVADIGALTLFTDGHGDGLYVCTSRTRGFEQVCAVRDFSLHRYDLTTDAGRRQAREYVRRKLSKLDTKGE